MKIEEKPPEVDRDPCPACGSQTATLADATYLSRAALTDIVQSARLLIESENSGLRRLVVDLIEKNQQLRDQLLATADRGDARVGADLRPVNGLIAS